MTKHNTSFMQQKLFQAVGGVQEDDVPLTKRIAKIATPVKKPKLSEAGSTKAKAAAKPGEQKKKKKKRQEEAEQRPVKRRKSEPRAKSESRGKDEGKDVKWKTLMHSGVLFPPEYVAHGVKMTYDGKAVDLTPEQEEVRPVKPYLSCLVAIDSCFPVAPV